MNLKVIYPIGIFCSRQIEWYQNHENRTSETYLKLIQFYLITLVKVKCQGHFLGYFVFDLKFFHHMREMVGLLWRSRFNLHIHAQWSVVGRPAGCSGMILFSRKKMFRHDIGIRNKRRLTMKYSRRNCCTLSNLIIQMRSDWLRTQLNFDWLCNYWRCKSEMTGGDIPDYHLFDEISTNL